MIPLHPNCVLPGQLVHDWGILVASRASYDGVALRFTTMSGKVLAVTPNHPILTDHGFVAASSLRVGNNIINSSADVIGRRYAPNDYHIPTPIENVWDALSMKFSVPTGGVKVSAEDFHGDAAFFYGSVYIVGADGFLWDDGESSRLNRRGKTLFKNGLVFPEHLPSQGPLAAFINRSLTSASRCVCGLRLGLAVFLRKLGIPYEVGFADGSGLNPVCLERLGNNRTGYTDSEGNVFNALARIELTHDSPDVNIHAGFDVWTPESVIGKDVIESVTSNAKVAADFFDGHFGLYHPDKIVAIDDFAWRGHVYDLQTKCGVFPVNNLTVHNCVCRDVPLPIMQATDPAFEPASKGEWIAQRATDQQQRSILGVGRSRLLQSGAMSVPEMFANAKSALSRVKKVDLLARAALRKKSRSQLTKAARSLGVVVTKNMTRADIIAQIVGRSV